MRIVVMNRNTVESIPPLVSVIEILRGLGHDVHVITSGISKELQLQFSKDNISYSVIEYKVEKNLIKKIKYVYKFRRQAYHIMKEYNPDLVWMEGGGAIRLFTDIKGRYKYIVQISELYEKNKKIHNALKKIIYDAEAVVMPEYNRATLYQVEYQLNYRPWVLPNKPYFWLSSNQISKLEEKYKIQLEIFKKKKVILYQGIIHEERDLTKFCEAVKTLGDDYVLILLGSDWGALSKYKLINPNIVHIDFISAPDYLIFTMYAYIGIVTYDSKNLNCSYCAPNKIFEYAKYGLPMIGNDIPGLKYTVESANAGILVDTDSVEDITRAIRDIENNYEQYSKNATNFFKSVDNEIVVKSIIEKVNGGQKMNTTYERALNWVHNNTVENNGGIVVFNTKRVLYPEVTGYYIPSLLEAGEKELAISFARKLCSIQKADGSWYDADDKFPFIFDGGQILKGLIAIRDILPEVDDHIIKGIDWILNQMDENGRLVQPDTSVWGKDDSHCNDLIHLYAISPILEAAKIYNRNDYKDKVDRIIDFYIDNYRERIVNYSLFSHFYAYVIEGLIDCGRVEIAQEAMDNFEKYRGDNGFVPAYNDVNWVCSTALFQFSIIWYKLGQPEKANKTYAYACALQNLSGGWYGSYGKNEFEYQLSRVTGKLGLTRKMYARNSEISWAVKFYLDATSLKKKSEEINTK